MRSRVLIWGVALGVIAALSWPAQPAQAAAYSYRWLTQGPALPTTPDTTVQLSLTIQNTGSASWAKAGSTAIRIGTDRPRDRTSPLHHSSWISGNRVATFAGRAQLDGSGQVMRDGSGNVIYDAGATTVAPGQAAHFVFTIKTPNHPATSREHFNPVVDGVTWLPETGIYWPLSIAQGYAAQWVGQASFPAIDKGSSPVGSLYFDYKNSGSFSWHKNGVVRLATTRNRDRSSGFVTTSLTGASSPTLPLNASNWLSNNRVGTFAGKVTGGSLDSGATTIAPGETARFVAPLDTREVASGTHREYFQLVADGFDWLFDYGAYMDVAVSSSAPKVAAAGDIACDPADSHYNGGAGTSTRCRMMATSDLLVGGGYAKTLVLGDIQYENGTLTKFNQSYDPSWGRVKATTAPVPGNHEYLTANAQGYYDYFGALAADPDEGYYSFDIGNWHLIALNSNCAAVGGCGAGSAQETWLRADLAASTTKCTLAYWHHPRFSSGPHGNDATYDAFWQALEDYDADLILTGHDHIYERFHRQSPAGVATTDGLRQFVVGTGGKNLTSINTVRANSAVRSVSAHGVLDLRLNSHSYDWTFRPVPGQSLNDTGSTACR